MRATPAGLQKGISWSGAIGRIGRPKMLEGTEPAHGLHPFAATPRVEAGLDRLTLKAPENGVSRETRGVRCN